MEASQAQATEAAERRSSERAGPSELADVLYDAFYSAAIGGATLGLFFMLVDSTDRGAFFTPSLLGSVLFLGMAPDAVTEIRLDMVAYFTMLHFLMFGWLGMALSLMVHEVEVHFRHPREVVGALFVVLEGGFLIGARLFMPGVIDQIGFGRIVVGNLLTALAMSLFMMKSHNPEGWDRLIHGKPFV